MASYNRSIQSPENKGIIGVVGGMGPESGIYLCNQLIAQTRADADQEHFPFILMSLPRLIGDRSAYLAGQHMDNPAYEILDIIGKLEKAGADIIGITCNTAHSPAIYDVILKELKRQESPVRLLNMPEETCYNLKENFPLIKRVGLMTTNGTYNSGIYESLLAGMGYDVVLPDPGFQDAVIHRAVYDPEFGIKANPGKCSGELNLLLTKAVDFFEEQQAQAVILGCTEFSLVNMSSRSNLLFIDSSASLAEALLREAGVTENSLCRV
jgi:aspartate racemase